MTKLSTLRAAQPHALHTLSQALSGGRRHHAYLLAGPPEAGTLALAEAFAGSLVCTQPNGIDACGECVGCRKFDAGNHPDVHRVSSGDKATISIDAIRYLNGRLGLAAAESAVKIAIIEEADRMQPPAQNALLKTLEEPTGATCFLLTTSRVRSLLPTVRSRSQTLRLAPLPRQGAWQALAEAGIDAELARPLAVLVGNDVDRATDLVDRGADEVIATLAPAMRPNADHATVLSTAAELGSDRDKAELALALIEVEVRDRLARAHGAGDDKLYLHSSPGTSMAALEATAAALQHVRRLRVFNPNRTMALETVLLALTGRGDTARGVR